MAKGKSAAQCHACFEGSLPSPVTRRPMEPAPPAFADDSHRRSHNSCMPNRLQNRSAAQKLTQQPSPPLPPPLKLLFSQMLPRLFFADKIIRIKYIQELVETNPIVTMVDKNPRKALSSVPKTPQSGLLKKRIGGFWIASFIPLPRT